MYPWTSPTASLWPWSDPSGLRAKTTTLRMIAGPGERHRCGPESAIGGPGPSTMSTPATATSRWSFQKLRPSNPHNDGGQEHGLRAWKIAQGPQGPRSSAAVRPGRRRILGIEDLPSTASPRQVYPAVSASAFAVGRAIVREPQALPVRRAALQPWMPSSRLANPGRAQGPAPAPQNHKPSTSPTTRKEAIDPGRPDRPSCPRALSSRSARPLDGLPPTRSTASVAAFIGSPPNELSSMGRLAAESSEAEFIEDAPSPRRPHQIRVRAPRPPQSFRPHSGKPVILGIRPQSLRPGAGPSPPSIIHIHVRPSPWATPSTSTARPASAHPIVRPPFPSDRPVAAGQFGPGSAIDPGSVPPVRARASSAPTLLT